MIPKTRRLWFKVDPEPGKKKIRKKKVEEQITHYVARLRRQTRVWTIFDEENSARQRTAETPGGFAPSYPR